MLDPQVAQLLREYEAADQPPLESLPVSQARDLARMAALLDGDPEPVDVVEDRTLPGPAEDIPVRLYRPAGAAPLPVLAWFHAGGGVVGDLETADRSCRRLANRSGALVVSVDYRRAPEHVFPAAVDDCWAVTSWLAEHAAELGGDPARLAVGGDSAGGGFAAVVAQRAARDRVALRHQVLVYPFVDLTLSYPSVERYAQGHILTKSLYAWFAETYLGPDGDAKDPAASPLHAEDVSVVAPATVLIAECDPVHDEGLAYAERLRAAGVPVTLHRYDGMVHVFFAMSGVIGRADEAMEQVAAALRAALV